MEQKFSVSEQVFSYEQVNLQCGFLLLNNLKAATLFFWFLIFKGGPKQGFHLNWTVIIFVVVVDSVFYVSF